MTTLSNGDIVLILDIKELLGLLGERAACRAAELVRQAAAELESSV
ncbi:MAG: hypothetical protein MZW92_52265 [Comamonadaceae bacterium]|nr:hypothetical protein [Comamonadaceae bacterium]